MTCNEMLPAIGATVLIACDSLNVACTVADVKTAWGRPRLLVRPLAGNGEMWVELSRIRMGEARGAQVAGMVAWGRC